jgi:hypothetical protein
MIKTNEKISRTCIILSAVWLDPGVDFEVSKCAGFLAPELEFVQLALIVNLVSQEHFFRVLGADDLVAEGFCGEAIDVIGMGVSEKM